MLIEPLDAILGTRAKVRLLRELAPLNRAVSGREAARLAGISSWGIRALDELAAVGLVVRQETAGQHLYTLNHEHRLASTITELFTAERTFTRAAFDLLAGVLEKTGAVVSAVVFGSMARYEAGPESDLDVLVLVEGSETKESIYDVVVRIAPRLEKDFGLRVSPVVLTTEEARRQAKKDSFIVEAIRDGRRISGAPIEEVLHGQARRP